MREIVDYRITAVPGLFGYGAIFVKDGKSLECISLGEFMEMHWIKYESNLKVGDKKDRLGVWGYDLRKMAKKVKR